MNETDPPKAETQDGRAKAKEREENAKKAQETADWLFPGHEWIKVEDGIYRSSNKAIGKKTNYGNELRDAQILRDFGSTVYLMPERNDAPGKKTDAIVNGDRFEFKNVGGNTNTLEAQFMRSRRQAPNVFINLENSDITEKQALAALRRARNKQSTDASPGYDHYNRFKGGTAILKLRGREKLVYVDIDSQKNAERQKKTGR